MKRLPNRPEEDPVSNTGNAQLSPPWSTTVKIVVIVFSVVVVGAIVLRFQDVIAPLVIACLIAYVLTPLVNFIAAHTRIPCGLVTAAIYLLVFGLIVLLVSLLAPFLVRQVRSFQLDFQEVSTSVGTFFSQPLQIGTLRLDLPRVYDELVATLTGLIQPLATQTVALLAGVVSIVIQVIFIGLVSFYLTKDGPAIGRWLAQWVPPRLRHDVARLQQELGALWRAFFRGQLLLATTVGLILGVLMAALGMKNALILGLLAFILEFLPSVGHGIWLTIAVPLALFQGSLWIPIPNFWFAVLVLGIHLVLQQVDLNFLIPRIVGRQMRLHPIVVIIGIIGGGMLAGVLGILLAAPTIASAAVLARYVHSKLLDLPPWPGGPGDLDAPNEPGEQADTEVGGR